MRSGSVTSLGPVSPTDLELYGAVPGVAAVARDEQLRVFWCNDAFLALCQRPMEDVIGTTPFDLLPEVVAEERASASRRVMETGTTEVFFQFGADRRFLCTVVVLDASEFGHRGVLALLQTAPCSTLHDPSIPIPVLQTPSLDLFQRLTPREMELLHFIALGETTEDAASTLFRSVKTVEGHLTSIHRKLGTKSRAELVRYLVERGVAAFTREEWMMVVAGAARVKRAGKSNQLALAGAPDETA
ncbi:MAG: PAS domain-containing protein [Phycisphaeraceae bacterium]|nr:PAS domain-containing protein [Phycisphaerales bacterium]MCB9859325.1 PAS domain-containing protein [Phycisphaeraceae bacterium]